MRCYWSCLPWIVAWSWWKDNVTSTFFTYCHISHLHWVYRTHPQSRIHKNTQVTLLTAHQLYQWSLPWGHQLVWLTASYTLRRYPARGLSFCYHTHTSVPLQLNMHTIMYLLLTLTFLLLKWFVSHVPLNGMCLFSAFSANLDVDATLKKKTKQIKTENMFPNCGGWGLRGEHNINQGCWVRNTARGSSRHPTSS